MLRTDVERQLLADRREDGYLFPDYDGFCFANVPHTLASVLGVDTGRRLPDAVFDGVETDVDTVVVVVIDGYGFDSWRRDRDRFELLADVTERGTVTPLTSIYPSETAAAMTTFETGDLPCEHGRIGWNVYDPATDRSFLALDGSVKHGDEPGTVASEAFDGIEFLYPRLANAGVDCHRLQPIAGEADGVTQHTYEELDEMGSRLARIAGQGGDPSYVYAYLPHVDGVSHESGTESEAFQRTLGDVLAGLERFIEELDATAAAETLLVVTADHGHVDTDPDRNVDLSARPGLRENLARYADGEPVRTAGSPRNVHLHLRDGTLEETRAALSDLDARTFTRTAALERELFGDRPPSDRFRRRCGDLVLSHRTLGAWFGDVEPDELDLVGMHGGLHPDEMLVPFAVARADSLR